MTRKQMLKTINDLENIYLPRVMTKNEIEKTHENLGPFSYKYVIFNKNDILKFSFNIGTKFPLDIIIEWNNDDINCKIFSDHNIKKTVDLNVNDINILKETLYKNDFFNSTYDEEDKKFAIIVGSGVKDWEMEIKIGNDYNNISTHFLANKKLINILDVLFEITDIDIDEITKQTIQKIDKVIKQNMVK